VRTGWPYVLTPHAKRAMERLPAEVQRRIYAALDRLVSDIHSCDVRKLAGHDREFRLRVGDFRVNFGIEAEDRVYIVFEVTDRKDAYR
jgi:mRNA-degrading endonuclease RelE of RelBE toxin-antitoxin system